MTPRQLLGHARAAYLAESLLGGHLDNSGSGLISYLDCSETGTQGFVSKTPSGRIVVAFRGTEVTDWRDLKTDLNWRLTPYPQAGLTHLGFTLAANSVLTRILDVIQETPGDVYITGHSLGAAVATLVAFEIELQIPERIQAVHTFGSPRVGCPAFAAAYSALLDS